MDERFERTWATQSVEMNGIVFDHDDKLVGRDPNEAALFPAVAFVLFIGKSAVQVGQQVLHLGS